MTSKPQLVLDDPWLEPYAEEISQRIHRFQDRLSEIEKSAGGLLQFAGGYKYFGFAYDDQKKGWWYREWAPAANSLYLIGDFNDWNRYSHPMAKIENGVWEIFVEDPALHEGSKVKVHVVSDHAQRDRIPAYAKRVVQDEHSNDFCCEIYDVEDHFTWTDAEFQLHKIYEEPFIYEAHVGIAQEKEGVGTFNEFTDKILPRIKACGYNVIQLMAVQEHPYYGSFGYHVSNFFAPSSRFGKPDDLKRLINTAHKLGLAVIIDLVHSHSVKNISEGLNDFDGSGNQYFHAGGRGEHTTWDSKLFDYGRPQVMQFLLSNIRYWIEVFHVDGFRFDGVTSMMYFHHGDFMQFDHYDKYFTQGVDWDALIYLQLANTLTHQLKQYAINVAEDMSGMPGLCRQVEDGGIGFDFRLGMGIPDFWIKYLKEKRDEDWNIHELWSVMTNRRWKEKTVAYAESHDQAIVGDKTIAFWLMDKEMYYHMQVSDENLKIDRGIAMHKLIKLLSASLGGEAYLNFIGNEFGHPEWVDFPREGNNWSYHFARRQWSLADNPNLKYKYLYAFDEAMVKLLKKHKVLSAFQGKQLNMDDFNSVMIYERANLIFAINFNPLRSIPDYRCHVQKKGKYKIILSSDDARYGGYDRVDTSLTYQTFEGDMLSFYLPNRTALVLKKV